MHLIAWLLLSASGEYFYNPVKENNTIFRTDIVRSEIYDIVDKGFYDIECVCVCVCVITCPLTYLCNIIINNQIQSMALSFYFASDRYFYIHKKENKQIVRTETVRSEIYDIV